MVREGKMAKTVACKEAEVKKPVSGKFRGLAKGAAPAQIWDGEKRAKRVASAQTQNGEKTARKVTAARMQNGEETAREVVAAQVRDGSETAGRVYSADMQDGEKQMAHVVPLSVRKAELEDTLQGGQETAEENPAAVQKGYPVRADSGLTLAQLFGRN